MKLTRTDTFILGLLIGGVLVSAAFSSYFLGEKVGMESVQVSLA